MTAEAAPGPFASAFAAALARRDVSLSWLRSRLVSSGNPVSLATLSYWRSGRRTPEHVASMAAVAEVELLLDLEPGELSRLVQVSRRVGPPVTTASVSETFDPGVAVAEALAEIGIKDPTEGLRERGRHLTMDLDVVDGWHRMTSVSAYRAVEDGVARLARVMTLDVGFREPPRRLRVHGAERGRVIKRLAAGVYVVELCFDQPLRVGEVRPVEISLEVPSSGVDDRSLRCQAQQRMRQVSVWVRFGRSRRPVSADYFVETADDLQVLPVDTTGRASLFHAVEGFGPGTVGIRWRW